MEQLTVPYNSAGIFSALKNSKLKYIMWDVISTTAFLEIIQKINTYQCTHLITWRTVNRSSTYPPGPWS